MSNTVRMPIQQRSIDKKNRIIQAGYQLFAEKGYFSTNTREIAKCAGVSTGIVYGYFHDKRDILLEVLEVYVDNVFYPVFEMFANLMPPLDFKKIIPQILEVTIKTHQSNASIHEALHSLSATDKVVNDRFLALEGDMTKKIADKLSSLGYDKPHLNEKVHMAIEIIQSYAHECVYDKHAYIDYEVMKNIITDILLSLFLN